MRPCGASQGTKKLRKASQRADGTYDSQNAMTTVSKHAKASGCQAKMSATSNRTRGSASRAPAIASASSAESSAVKVHHLGGDPLGPYPRAAGELQRVG
jgi:hypothetical protein